MMRINAILMNAVIEDFRKIDLTLLDHFAIQNQGILSYLYLTRNLPDGSLDSLLNEKILNEAKREYYRILDCQNHDRKVEMHGAVYAHHVERPEFFAYALQKNAFSADEVRQIPFDMGHTVDLYIQKYGRENLLEELKEKLFNPKPIMDY